MRKPKQNKKKIIIGVTGSFGSGKTTVSSMLKSAGAYMIDADKIAHGVTRPASKIYRKIIKLFGWGVLNQNKVIERRRLGRIVFNDQKKLARLNALVHPEVIKQIKKKIKSAKHKIIVLDVPLLVESGLKNMVDKLVVVKASRNKQIERIKRKTPLTKDEILKRIRAQVPLSDKVRLADFVIDNSGTIKETKKQIERMWNDILGVSPILKRFGN